MSLGFVLGNGNSRLVVDLYQLKDLGKIYACNGVYRDFTPDVLIATDPKISTAIQESGYSQNNRFHTRRPINGLGARTLPKAYKGFSSGPNALAQACIDGCTTMYLVGFDLGSTHNQFNNVFADTEFYKKSVDPPTFAGNWVKQIQTVMSDYKNNTFVRVEGPESVLIPQLNQATNFKTMPMDRFIECINTRKGLL